MNAAGTGPGNGTSSRPVFSPDGTKVAFVSWASNLAAPDTDKDQDVFIAAVVPAV